MKLFSTLLFAAALLAQDAPPAPPKEPTGSVSNPAPSPLTDKEKMALYASAVAYLDAKNKRMEMETPEYRVAMALEQRRATEHEALMQRLQRIHQAAGYAVGGPNFDWTKEPVPPPAPPPPAAK